MSPREKQGTVAVAPIPKPHQQIHLYTGHALGGCSDVGVLNMDPQWVVITREEYDRLLSYREKVEALAACAEAIAEPAS